MPTIYIKSEVESRVFINSEDVGIVYPNICSIYGVNYGKQNLLLVSTGNTALCISTQICLDTNISEYHLNVTKSQYTKYTAPEFSVDLDNDGVKDEYGVIYSHDGTRLLMCTNKKLAHYRVKEGCKCICDWAFYLCKLKSISLPVGMTHIGDGSFYGCSSLTDIGLPVSIVHVGDVAFDNCFTTDPSTITLQGKLLYWGRTCHWANPMLFKIYIPLGLTKYYAKVLPEDLIGNLEEDSEVCPQIVSVNQRFSLREFAELKGKPTKASIIKVKDHFDNSWEQNCMVFGDQPVIFSSSIMSEHAGQNAHEIAIDIIRNASQYCVRRSDFFQGVKYLMDYSKNQQMVTSSVKGQSFPNQLSKEKKPYYIFFDTETTGVPMDYNAPASNTRNWPRLVQLGWILTDEKGNTISSGCEIVMPKGYVIPADAVKVHGITTEKATRVGKTLRDVINRFLKDANQAQLIVGHNISFDQHIVGAELYRLDMPDTISNAKSICTMQSSTDFCKIPGNYGYKWPQLQELYKKLFGTNFEDAHDAMADVKATKKCFLELKRLGIIDK